MASKLKNCLCIDDLRNLHRQRTPKMFFDYVDSGSWKEVTKQKNQTDFEKIELVQHVGVDISERSSRTTVLGHDLSAPIILAPVGLLGLQWPNGEIEAARAAAQKGLLFTLSTMSMCSIEELAEEVDHPFWFQLYPMRDEKFQNRMLDAAKHANCPALVLTLDLMAQGMRHADTRNGLSAPPRLSPKTFFQFASKPLWLIRMLAAKRLGFGNLNAYLQDPPSMKLLSHWVHKNFRQDVDWDSVRKFRKLWSNKLILKGILNADDARSAVSAGADAIVVSNHGGRQLDGAPSTISVLEQIVDAVDGKIEVFVDSGIRSGQDVYKAIALGAKAALVGRAYAYAVGAGGGEGVRRAIDILTEELNLTLALAGKKRVDQLRREDIVLP